MNANFDPEKRVLDAIHVESCIGCIADHERAAAITSRAAWALRLATVCALNNLGRQASTVVDPDLYDGLAWHTAMDMERADRQDMRNVLVQRHLEFEAIAAQYRKPTDWVRIV